MNGPPWNLRVAVRVHHGIIDPAGDEIYANRAILMVNLRWAKIQAQEDYEDTERVAAYDELIARREAGAPDTVRY